MIIVDNSAPPQPSAFHSLLSPSENLASSCQISSPMLSARRLSPVQVVYFLLSFDILYIIFHYLSLNTPVQLDVLAVVVDVVAGVVDVQGHVLVLQVLLQSALV